MKTNNKKSVNLIKEELSTPDKKKLLLIKDGENNHVKKNGSNNNRGKSNCVEYIVNKPTIFTKKRKIVVIKPLTYINSDTGKTMHFTPAAQEWYNSVYAYNHNYTKGLPIADKNLMSLLKSYFNAKLNKELFKTKIKPMQTRFKRLSTKRTFVGKGYLKHTNNKVSITFFVYNTEGMYLSSLFRAMETKLLLPKKDLRYRITWERNGDIIKTFNRWFTLNEYLSVREHKELYYSYITSIIEGFTNKLEKVNGYFSNITDLTSNKVLTLRDKLRLFNEQFSSINTSINNTFYCNSVENNGLSSPTPPLARFIAKYNPELRPSLTWKVVKKSAAFKNYERIAIRDYMSKYNMYKLLLKINKIKFNLTFISKLMYLVNKIYNKRVEFNIVNLKKMHLNSDIYTQAVSLKLRNKDNKLYRILKASLRKVKLPTIRKVSEKGSKPDKNEFIINKIRNNIITRMFINDEVKDPLSNLLLNFYPLADNIRVVRGKKFSVLLADTFFGSEKDSQDKKKENVHTTAQDKTGGIPLLDTTKQIKSLRSISLASYVRKWLKHMKLRGIRVEAKGRLTRRATASRSVFKMKWKGGLKNVDSSFRGLSTILLRGHVKSNVQYTLISSKNRNGAFGVKGWVSSK